MVGAAVAFAGKLDVVVNNAGANPVGGIEDLDIGDWRHALNVNITGAMLVTRAAIPEIRAVGGGSIVNIASVAGLSATAGVAAYCTSKAGLIMCSRQAALDLGPHGIRVNAVCPAGCSPRSATA
jgi:NAD(P)-dependent dehydrogenase (short-subunit alcohol dehydrogenase family)